MKRVITRWFAHRPTLHVAVLTLWAARAFCGWLVALPISRVVAATGVSARENGDAVFFEPGGFWLIELLRQFRAPLWASLEGALYLAVLASAALMLPTALVFVTSARPETSLGVAWRRAWSLAPQFLVIALVEAIAGTLLIALVLLVGRSVTSAFSGAVAEPTEDLLLVGFLLAGVLVTAAVSIVGDTTRGALAREPLQLTVAAARGFATLQAARGPLIGAYALACGVSWLGIAAAARLTELLRLERGSALALVAVVLVHQLALLNLAAVQGWWARRIARVSSTSI